MHQANQNLIIRTHTLGNPDHRRTITDRIMVLLLTPVQVMYTKCMIRMD